MTTDFHRRRVLRAGAAAAAGSTLLSFSGIVHAAVSRRFAIGEHAFLLDGKPFQIRCGEMHFGTSRACRASTGRTA
jgi:beta-galactosidase